MTLSKRLWKLPTSTSKKQNIYNIYNNRVKLNRDIHLTCILRLLNNTCVKHNFKSVHVSNLFWSREYNSAKEICKYPSFSKVGGNYPLDLKINWSSVISIKNLNLNLNFDILYLFLVKSYHEFWWHMFLVLRQISIWTDQSVLYTGFLPHMTCL